MENHLSSPEHENQSHYHEMTPTSIDDSGAVDFNVSGTGLENAESPHVLTLLENSSLDDVSLLDDYREHTTVVSRILSMILIFSFSKQNSSASEAIYLFAVTHKRPKLSCRSRHF